MAMDPHTVWILEHHAVLLKSKSWKTYSLVKEHGDQHCDHPTKIRFADTVFKPLGKVDLPIFTAPGQPTTNVELNVVSANIPSLLDTELMGRESITPCTIVDRLVICSEVDENAWVFIDLWHAPLHRTKSGNIFAEMDCETKIYISNLQLIRLRRKLSNPSNGKLLHYYLGPDRLMCYQKRDAI